MPENTIAWLEPTEPEWERAWRELRRKRIAAGAVTDPEDLLPEDIAGAVPCSFCEECPETGEVWQYMGTVIPPDRSWLIVHQFRHRCARRDALIGRFVREDHSGHDRCYVNIPASPAKTAELRGAHPANPVISALADFEVQS